MKDQRDEIIEHQAVRLAKWTDFTRTLLIKGNLIASDRVPSDSEAQALVATLIAKSSGVRSDKPSRRKKVAT